MAQETRRPAGRCAVSNQQVLPLKIDFDPKSLERVKHTRQTTDANNNVTKTSVEVPKLSPGASKSEMLYFFGQFKRASRTMGWTTGPVLFEKLEMHLDGSELSDWSRIVDGMNHTVANFNACRENFIGEHFTDTSYDDHIAHLRCIRKPADMTPQEFLRCIKTHNMFLPSLPGAPDDHAELTEPEIRRIYLAAMPKMWQGKFEDANMTAANSTLVEIQDYMEKQANKDPFDPNRKSGKNNRNNNQ